MIMALFLIAARNEETTTVTEKMCGRIKNVPSQLCELEKGRNKTATTEVAFTIF